MLMRAENATHTAIEAMPLEQLPHEPNLRKTHGCMDTIGVLSHAIPADYYGYFQPPRMPPSARSELRE